MASGVGAASLQNPNFTKLLQVADPTKASFCESHRPPKALIRPKRRVCGAVRARLSDSPAKEPATVPAQTSQNGATKANPGSGGSGSFKSFVLQAKIFIRKKKSPSGDEQWVDRMDVIADTLGQKILLQLVSNDIDPATQTGKRSKAVPIKDWAAHAFIVADMVQYSAVFHVDSSFGVPGGLIVTNHHQNEFFLESVSLSGHPSGPIHFPAHSWMHSEISSASPRVFFSNQVYLPSATPPGLRDLREQDLNAYRGDGKGMRQEWENVYDYDVYNDLGDVDKDKNQARPILGGSEEFPYPRRNRTGRPRAKTDPAYESRLPDRTIPYVPRDEKFEELKQKSYLYGQIRGLVQGSVPEIVDHFRGSPKEFDSFVEIDSLYSEGLKFQNRFSNLQTLLGSLQDLPFPDIVRTFAGAASDQTASILRYPLPELLRADRYSWISDREFARQTLAGLNPCAIERLKVFPPVSSLDDPALYGPKESAIEAKHIEDQLLEEGLTIEQAVSQGKLFILDYHDVFTPFINDINSQAGQQSYASRTLFLLQKGGTLKPLAIELSLPPPHQSSRVFTPSNDSTESWFWTMAKAHVGCNDAGYHQLISHWLRTHACTEPYIIATNRQLSPLHPVYKLLHPHFRYTMEINAAARQSLIPAGGVIEKTFLPGKYAMRMSSAIYGTKWRFDKQGHPQDLIERGVAKEDPDPESPTGVKLLIEDYPFAQDGLLIWSAIKSWVEEYVQIYYKDAKSVQQDQELQRWWEEIREHGHRDKRQEDWWPQLQSGQDLSYILTTMMWVTSGLHAAVNFGQFTYAGYMPNKPTLMRKLIPQPNTREYEVFMRNPQAYFLSSLPSQEQATVLMAVVESLSTHSPDEEYLSSERQPHWFGSEEVVDAFKRFQEKMKEAEIQIHNRNEEPSLRNRSGAGIVPYELLMPSSSAGITGRGIPNSISI